jgi:hypothetical protein
MKIKFYDTFYSGTFVENSKIIITGEYNEMNDVIPLTKNSRALFEGWFDCTHKPLALDYKKTLFFVTDSLQQGVAKGCWCGPQDFHCDYNIELTYDSWHLLKEAEEKPLSYEEAYGIKNPESWGVTILHVDYEQIIPQPLINAVAVFSKEDAEKAFRYCPSLGFVYTINEDTGKSRHLL